MMLNKKYTLIVIILFISFLSYLGYLKIKENILYDKIELSYITEYDEHGTNYRNLETFFENNFIKEGNPITNLISQNSNKQDIANNNDVLSESMGLLMQKALKDQDEETFNLLWQKVDNNFKKSNELIAWKLPLKDITYGVDETIKNGIVNATIDDLRIVKALFRASEMFGNDDYRNSAVEIGNALKMDCVKENKLLSFDDETSDYAIWTYYDLEAMYKLSNYDSTWKKVLVKSIEDIKGHQITGKPFFYQKSEQESFKSIENLIVLMHLYEIGLEDSSAIEFIKMQINESGYYGEYDADGRALNDIESPAIYGIIAQIAKLDDDHELYMLATDKLNSMMNYRQGKYYGGYINLDNKESFSFDQLMAMLGY